MLPIITDGETQGYYSEGLWTAKRPAWVY